MLEDDMCYEKIQQNKEDLEVSREGDIGGHNTFDQCISRIGFNKIKT